VAVEVLEGAGVNVDNLAGTGFPTRWFSGLSAFSSPLFLHALSF
jgi:hypothetical protein